VRARYQSMEQKKEFLDTIVRFEILAREADKRGFDEDPEVVRTMKQVMIQRLLKEEFDTRVKPEDISDDEMKQYYEAHRGDYNKPEEVRVSAIIVQDKAKAQKAAEEARAPANAENRKFRELVEKYSEDADSKSRGGDLRFFANDTPVLPAEVVKAAFELRETGQVAGPIQTSQGWYVIKQTGLRKPINKSFEEVKRQIQNRLFRDKRNAAMETFVADLKKTAKIEVNDAALEKVKIDTTQPTPAGPGGEHGMAPGSEAPAEEARAPGAAPPAASPATPDK
jgi:peptidyl-prolyl cis-trans isomerase C